MLHPFLDASFETPWSQLSADKVVPDITEGLARARIALDKLAAQDPGSSTFASAPLALEESTEELALAWTKVSHLDAVMNAPDLRQAHNEMLPAVSEFFAQIPLREDLWKVLKGYADSPAAATLEGVQKRLLEETLKDFQEAGADLPKDKKDRLQAIEQELAKLTQKYSENCLDGLNAYELVIDDESRLAGLPEMLKETARANAESKGYGTAAQPNWRFTLHMPSMRPALKYLDDRDIRRQLMQAFMAVGREEPYDNRGLVRQILDLRAEKARILGKPQFADVVLARRMAKSGPSALKFVEDLYARTKDAFSAEIDEIETFVAEKSGQPRQRLESWDLAYWGEKLRKERYDLDDEQLRPYFEVDTVISGCFSLSEKLFGVTITERLGDAKPEVWHPEVHVYDMHDAAGTYLGMFYTDWHPRESKRSGAWAMSLHTGGPRPDGSRLPHSGCITGNMTAPSGGKPALLTHDEVTTIFHEFGHLLHHLLGDVPIKSLSGTSVAWDFVELPSQILENWCWERESLDFFARHYETGEPIPEVLFQKMVAARNFQSASLMMRQLSFGKMDLELHINWEQHRAKDLDEAVDTLVEPYQWPTATPRHTNLANFSHLFSSPVGYAAGYYSYKWAEVLEADAFSRFKQEGLLSPQVGGELRDKILARGNAAPAEELFRDFMGRDPDPEALLVRSGLA